MLILSEVLASMGYDFPCNGDDSFDYLTLLNTEIKGKAVSFAVDAKSLGNIASSVSIVLTTPALGESVPGRVACVCDDPRRIFFELHNHLAGYDAYRRKDFTTQTGKGCRISPHAHIAEKNVILGDNVTVEEFASVREHSVIGANTVIRSGAVIGGEGFEFKRVPGGMLSVTHLGGVILGDNVEVQHNAIIDKAVYPWDNTCLGDWCKVDNLVHIAHAVKLQEAVMVAACTCVAGRVSVGKNVWIGPGVTLRNGIAIGDNARVNMGAVVSRDVPENGSVTGNFAIDHDRFMENLKKSTR